MADLNYDIDINATAGIKSIDRLTQSINTLSTKMNALKTTSFDNINRSAEKLSGTIQKLNFAGFVAVLGTMTTASIRFADSIKDISDATELSVANVLGFTDAIIDNGGSAENAEQALFKFTETIGDAIDGSLKAQVSFRKVKVSLDDLRKLSQADLLKKTIDGLAQIDDVAERARLKTELLGKSVRSVNLQGVADQLSNSVSMASRYSSAIDSAAAAQGNFEKAIRLTQLELLKGIQPLTDYFGKLTGKEIESLITSLKSITTIISPITQLIGKLDLLVKVLVLLGDTIKELSKVEPPSWLSSGGAFGGLGAITEQLLKYTGILDKLQQYKNAKIPMAESTAGAGRGGQGGPTAEELEKYEKQKRSIKDASDFELKLSEMVANYQKNLALRGSDEIKTIRINAAADIATAQRQIDEDVAKDKYTAEQGAILKSAKALEINARAETEIAKIIKGRTDNLSLFTLELQKQTKEYDLQLKDLQKRYQFETSLVGLTDDEIEQHRAMNDLTNEYNSRLRAVQDQIARLNQEQLNDPSNNFIAAKIKLLENEKVELLKFYDAARKELPGYITNLQSARLIEEDRLRTLENITKAIEGQISRQQQLGDLLGQANDKLKETQFAGAQQKRTPLEQQIAAIQEEARKAALEAGRVFAASYEGMDLTAQQAQELADGLTQIADAYQMIANEQMNQLVYSRSWEAGWKDAFDKYMDNARNAATVAGDVFNSITSNMENAIDRFVETGKFSFKDFARSIIQDLLKIELKAQAMKIFGAIGGSGGIISAIGSLLGFADGGTPPINKPSIVGEKGPELFVPKTAGTIIPNHALQGGMNNNAVSAPITNNYITNNISALDAKSVAQLFAENRKTLLGTVEMARKELPYATR